MNRLPFIFLASFFIFFGFPFYASASSVSGLGTDTLSVSFVGGSIWYYIDDEYGDHNGAAPWLFDASFWFTVLGSDPIRFIQTTNEHDCDGKTYPECLEVSGATVIGDSEGYITDAVFWSSAGGPPPEPPVEPAVFHPFALGFWYMIFAVAPIPLLFMVLYLPFLWFVSVFKEVKSTWV